jgi:2-polyprenyl-3-methyl-5-hydroxy-6-metoxy-1,4-benzoquinol methylase
VICNEVLYYVDDVPKQLDRIRDLITVGGHLLTSNVARSYDPGSTACWTNASSSSTPST